MSARALRPGDGGTPARLALELGVFAALAALAVGQWSRLLTDPPLGRLLAALAVALAAGIALGALGALRPPRWARVAVALAVAAVGLAGALMAVGLEARLVLPDGWDELAAGIGEGLAGIEDVDMPYGGADAWVRLTLLCGAGAALALAAAAAFWPAPGSHRGRIAALALLVVLYGIAVTLDSPRGELLWGALLLVLAGTWLCLPAIASARVAPALALLAAGAAIAVPAAAALESEQPWWDYESWDWFSRDRAVSFDWNHSYGPLDWPREGTTLLSARTEKPMYWKAAVLDRFDGFTWVRADPTDELASAELLARKTGPETARLAQRHADWLELARLEVRGLRSELVIGAGSPQVIEGVQTPIVSEDGTIIDGTGALGSGDAYTVGTYFPQPSPQEMRASEGPYPQRLQGSTLLGLPAAPPAGTAGGTFGFAPAAAVAMPLWGEPRGEARSLLLGSAYGEVFRLAQRLTASAPTAYDAARAIESHLSEGYDYTTNVPKDTFPLRSFLFEDEAGYCQQFSGAMALMLRMVGIPARVVSGFAPGSLDEESGAYEIRDTDAHAWVEVYFRGIGWVTFDPTPSADDAAPRSLDATAAGAGVVRDGSIPEQGIGRGRSLEEALEGGPTVAPDQEGPSLLVIAVLAVLGAGGLGLTATYVRGKRALARDARGEARARELLAALERFGWTGGPGVTLRAIERRHATASKRPLARYAAGLRALRYAPGSPGGEEPSRRTLRRTLAAGGGLRARVRALIAIPPGGPLRHQGGDA